MAPATATRAKIRTAGALSKELIVPVAAILQYAEKPDGNEKTRVDETKVKRAHKVWQDSQVPEGADRTIGETIQDIQKEFGVKVTLAHFKTAYSDPKLRQTSKPGESRVMVLSRLVETGSILRELLPGVDLPPVPSSGGTVVFVPKAKRKRTKGDDDKLVWMRTVIASDQKIRTDRKKFRPRYEATTRGDMVQYPDPMAQFLEPDEMNSKGDKKPFNVIRVSLEELEIYADDPQKNFRWRSNELLRAFERKLGSLWVVTDVCRACHREFTGGFREDVKKILRGDLVLPDEEPRRGLSRSKIWTPPELHDYCEDIRMALVHIRVALQDLTGPKFEAKRTELYIEVIARIAARYEMEGKVVGAALRDQLRVLKEYKAEREASRG